MSLSDTELSDEEIDYTEEITELEEEYRKILEGLDACLKKLERLDIHNDRNCRNIIIGKKTLGQIIRDSIGPNFGTNMIKFLNGE